MGKLKRLSTVFFLCMLASTSQGKVIEGNVFGIQEKNNQSILNSINGATVQLNYLNKVKQNKTDKSGNYSFSIPDSVKSYNVQVSHVGYFPIDTTSDEKFLALRLKPQVVELNSISVTGNHSINAGAIGYNTNLESTIKQSAFTNPSAVIGDPFIAVAETPVATRTSQKNATPEILGGKRYEVSSSIHNIKIAMNTKLGTTMSAGIGEMVKEINVKSDGTAYGSGGLAGNIEMTPNDKLKNSDQGDLSLGIAFYKGSFSKPIAGFGFQAGLFGTYGQLIEQMYDLSVPNSQSFESILNRDESALGKLDIYLRFVRGSINDGVSAKNTRLETSNEQDIIIVRNRSEKPSSLFKGLFSWDISTGYQHNKLSANNNQKDIDDLINLETLMETITVRPEGKLVLPVGSINSFYEFQLEKTEINGTLSAVDLGDGASFHQSFEALNLPTNDYKHTLAIQFVKDELPLIFPWFDRLTVSLDGKLEHSSLFSNSAWSYSCDVKADMGKNWLSKFSIGKNAVHPSNQEWMNRRIFFTDPKGMKPEAVTHTIATVAKQLGDDASLSLILSRKDYSNRYLAVEPDVWGFARENNIPDYSPESIALLQQRSEIIFPDYDIIGTRANVNSIVTHFRKGERESNFLFGSVSVGYQQAWDILPQRDILAYTGDNIFIMQVPEAKAKNNQHYGLYCDGTLGINVIRNKLNIFGYYERRSGWRKVDEQLVHIPGGEFVPEVNGPLYYKLKTSNNTNPISIVETLSIGVNAKIKGIDITLYAYDLENLILRDDDVVMEYYQSPYAIDQITKGRVIQEKKTPGYVTITFRKKLGF